jgi:hypothetical protein
MRIPLIRNRQHITVISAAFSFSAFRQNGVASDAGRFLIPEYDVVSGDVGSKGEHQFLELKRLWLILAHSFEFSESTNRVSNEKGFHKEPLSAQDMLQRSDEGRRQGVRAA